MKGKAIPSASSPPVEVPATKSMESRKLSRPGVATIRWSRMVVMSPRIPSPSMETTRYFAIWFSCKGNGSIYILLFRSRG